METKMYLVKDFNTVMSYVTACELLDFEYSMSKNVLPDDEIEYRLFVYIPESSKVRGYLQ